MDHVAGLLHMLLVEKREERIWFNMICLKLYQFEMIAWWCLSVVESILECVLEYAMTSTLLEKHIKKVIVSRNSRQAHLLEVALTKIPGGHETLSVVCHVGLHVDISSVKSSLGL